MFQNGLRRNIAILGMLSAGMLALAGCSGSESPSDPSGGETAPEQSSVDIALTGIGTISNAPLYLAKKLGYFEDRGLDVNLTEVRGGSDAIQSLVTGTVDATTNEYIHTLDLQVKNKSVESIATIATAPTYALVLTKGNFDKTVEDLPDMKIGVVSLGGSTEDLIRYVFETNGLDPEAASLVAIGVGQSQTAAVKARQVDALIATEPTLTTSLESGAITPLLDFRKSDVVEKIFGGASPFWSVLVTNEFAQENPNTTAALAQGVADALEYMSEHSAADIVSQLPGDSYYPSGDKAQITKVLSGMLDGYSHDGLMPEGGPQNIAQYMETANPDVKADDFALDKTFTNEFLESAK